MPDFNAKVIGSGTRTDPYRVDLPEYQLEAGATFPSTPNVTEAMVMINIPDRIFNTTTQRPDPNKIRALYQGNPLWDRPDVCSDV